MTGTATKQRPGRQPLTVVPPRGLPYKLTKRQLEVTRTLTGPQRHTMIVGGSRSGKTFLFCRAIVIRASRSPGSYHAILRLHYSHARQSIWLDTLPKVLKLCFPQLVVIPNHSLLYYDLTNGARIWVGGLDDKERVEKILGNEHATLYFNECSQIPYSSVLMARTRLAQKAPNIRNRCYYDLNPTGTGHWTAQEFIEHKRPDTLEALSDPSNFVYEYMNPEDNLENIDPAYVQELKDLPERMRKRFYEGHYVAQLDGALWTLEGIEVNRVIAEDVPLMRRIVVAVDPSGASGEFDVKSDQIGIVAAGLGVDGHAYVFEDATNWYSPENWGRVTVNTYHKYGADRVCGEKNFGGDMVRAIIHNVDPMVSYKEVLASRGKVIRAEPIAALYERGMVHHVGRFPRLEDEMVNFTSAGYLGSGSPNRADALVWCLTELFPMGSSHGFLDQIIANVETAKYGAVKRAGKDAPGLIGLKNEKNTSGFAKVTSDANWMGKLGGQPQPAAPEQHPLVSAGSLDDAQKEAADFMTSPKNLGKVATTKAPPQSDACPKCGNKFPQRFRESSHCGACGHSWPNANSV